MQSECAVLFFFALLFADAFQNSEVVFLVTHRFHSNIWCQYLGLASFRHDEQHKRPKNKFKHCVDGVQNISVLYDYMLIRL